ncbi:MAG: NAD(P)H-dependent oxidoreductase subunit E [Cyclobacteriaceae bacterium]|nr:NAD(P)H-dependent oxidoreductase subunit E [Cyclobacteriaceae bacterium]
MSENLSALSGRKGLDENLFEQLVQSSKVEGTPTDEKLRDLAWEYLMGNAITYGAASFYDFLNKENKGKKAYVCNGSACLVAGTQDKVHAQLSTEFSEDKIGHMCCLGRCHENSAFHIGGHNYSGDAINNLNEIVKTSPSGLEKYNVDANVDTPVLTGVPLNAEEFKNLFLKAAGMGFDKVLDEVKKANIRGRGGAGFPMGVKWGSCKNTGADQKFIVCNADEGDPGAYSDRYLLEVQPYSVLFGIMMGGLAIGANRGVVYLRAEYPEAIEITQNAIDELTKIGMNGKQIGETDFDFTFKIIEGAGAYICGEETALLSSIEGQRPEVRVRPPYPTQEGLFGKPTVVNNVETLAAVPWIIQNGGEAYAKLGTDKSSGTKLVCLDSYFNTPGMYEVEMGTPLREVVNTFGGGFKSDVKALHIGGPLGGIVPVNKIDELTIDFESFQSGGFLLGHASVVSIPQDFSMLKYVEHLFEFTAAESCGKCFPCSIGSVRGKEMFARARNGEPLNEELLNDLLETMELGSLCALGGGLPLGVKNALQYFREELIA